MQWDIKEYYPSITRTLLERAIEFAKANDVEIKDEEAEIIGHSRKAFLFSKGANDETIAWQKSTGEFDVTMGAPDGAEVCELVGIFVLNEVSKAFPRMDFGLYRDDGLAVHGRIPKRELEITQQRIKDLFQTHGLEVIFEKTHNTKAVNFLDVTLDLTSECFKPYRKPNDRPLYVHVESNHPQSVIKQIPKGINKRLSSISSSKEHFDRAAPTYQKALDESGHQFILNKEDPQPTRRDKTQDSTRKKRSIIYFTPPFNKALKTKIGRCFLNMVRKHFPPHHVLYPILNKNTLKISYSCTANIKKIMQAHNKKVLQRHKRRQNEEKKCNCQKSKRDKCPLRGHCNRKNVVYKATTPGPNPHIYVGVTENFKARWHVHKQSFKNSEYKDATALSTYVWEEKLGEEPDIRWEIIDSAPTYCAGQRSCQLCLTEKFQILKHSKLKNCLNVRNELAQMCRHKASYRLGRVKDPT